MCEITRIYISSIYNINLQGRFKLSNHGVWLVACSDGRALCAYAHSHGATSSEHSVGARSALVPVVPPHASASQLGNEYNDRALILGFAWRVKNYSSEVHS